jgi:hypothetical protein
VLVNFDADRAKAAAGVLRDFAAAGHQLLVFTCHEHILRLFKALKTPAGQLPDHAEAAHAPVMLEEPPRDKPKRARAAPASAPAPRKAASRAKPVEPEEPEEPEDELSDELDEDAEEEDERLWESEEEGDEEAAAEDDADLWDEEDTDDDDEDAGIFGAYRLD